MRVISIRTWRTKAGSETTVPSDRTTITSSTLRWLGRRESIRCFATYESGLLVSVSSDVRPETEQGPDQAEREEDEHAPDGEHPSWPPRGKRGKASRTETEASHLSSFDLTRRCAPGLLHCRALKHRHGCEVVPALGFGRHLGCPSGHFSVPPHSQSRQ